MKTIYLDYAAATPIDESVLAVMQPYFSELFYNPSATYLAAKQVHQAIETARASVAAQLGARPSEIIFTAGGTEANNLAIDGIMRRFPGKKLLVSSIEHESVLAAAAQYDYQTIPVSAEAVIDLSAVERLCDDDTVLISIMYANNEVGSVQPLRQLSQVVAAIRQARRQAGNELPLYLHSDAAQAANYLDLHVSRLGVDLLTINGGKIYGPKQSGVLYVRAGLTLEPSIRGGGQERNVRSGTENVAGIIGLARALELVQERRPAETERMHSLQGLFFDALAAKIPSAIINGSQKRRLPNNVHITLPGTDNERLLMQLDEAGIIAAAGSACSASSEEPSHVLRAMGLTDSEAQSSLRLTMGSSTTNQDVERTVATLAQLLG